MFAKNRTRRRPNLNLNLKRRNQRAGLHQLDVRMHSRKEAQLKTIEFFKLLLRISGVTAVIVATFFSSRWIYKKAFYENNEFALTELSILTDGELTVQRILKEGNIEEGVNILRIDIEELRERLGQLPQVKDVEVRRVLPNQLKVRIEERAPVAWISCPAMGIRPRTSDRGFMLDAEGFVVPCEALLRKYLNLPVIRAASLPRVKLGAVIESEQVLAALDLIEKSDELFFDRQIEILEAEIRNGYSIRAYYNNDAEVTFGMEDIEDQLNDLKLIMAHTNAKNRSVETLNLMVRKNIPVTYFEGPANGSETPRRDAEPIFHSEPGSPAQRHEGRERLDAIRAILGRG